MGSRYRVAILHKNARLTTGMSSRRSAYRIRLSLISGDARATRNES
jgi:hypothetical protein